MSVTQGQLAKSLGVSQMSVSLALNDKPGVNAETRQRIIEAAAQRGYRPHAGARATRGGRTQTIELILGLHEAVSRIPAGLLEGVHDELAQRGLHLLVGRVPDAKLTDERFLPSILREVAADGLLINYTHMFPPRLRDLIDHYDIPAIWLNAPVDQHCVRPDDALAGQLATEHLLAGGCQRIGMFVIGFNDHYSVDARQRGYTRAMQAAGREPMFEMRGERLYAQIRQDLLSDDRLALTRSWLVQAAADGLDAVVAYSQAEAAMLSLAAAELGLSLPDDLAIVTIADEVPPQLGRPTTTVVLPWRRIGQQAVAALAQRCEAARGTDSLETQPRDAPDAPDAPPTLIQVPPALVQGVTSHAPTG